MTAPHAEVQLEQHRYPRFAAAHLARPEVPAEHLEPVTQLLALVGHVRDNGADQALAEIFTPDVVLDDAGEVSIGLSAVARAFAARRNELSQHTVNSVVRQSGSPEELPEWPDELVAWSRLITITADGKVASADVLDQIVGGPGAWRISRRTVRPRHGQLRDAESPDGEAADVEGSDVESPDVEAPWI